MEFETAKILSIIGLVLMIVGSGHFSIGIVGLVLYLVGLYYLSNIYGREEIFSYAFKATIGFLVVLIIVAFVIGVSILGGAIIGGHIGLGVSVIIGWILLYLAMLYYGLNKRDLMNVLGEYGDRSLAGLTAKLYWYGAILTIIIIGALIVLIAEVLEVIVLATLKKASAAL
ncbi:hypothetical protein PYJP_00250 [Pyrofollis japonicus]|uniref:DUF996 domain-containing protein n=1 Tax=Pyrofollis japonicus TaxID=3060460 RepID=UPI00295C26F4|nr:DUF996 domain-containing protein [Pyrofollis japonicus]BEP16673.1 hypothetical protein PYJP_00250 [Pyrofollis japonicus]